MCIYKKIQVWHRKLWSWYTDRWWVGCYTWYSEEGTGRGRSPLRPLIAVLNVTAHPSAASVPITVLLYNGPLLCGFNVAIKGLKPISDYQKVVELTRCAKKVAPPLQPSLITRQYGLRWFYNYILRDCYLHLQENSLFFIFNKNQSPQKPSTCINLIQQWCHYDVIFVLIYTVFIKKHPPFYITSRTSSSLLRHRATLRAIEHLAESFKVTQGHSKWQCSAGRV